MVEINNILFPVDLSETVDELVPYAVLVAKKFDAALHLLTVIPDMASVASLYAPESAVATLQDDVLAGARKQFDAWRRRFHELPRVTAKILTGGPAEQIIATAQAQGMDLIVMGTHGRRGLEKSAFGSVCDKVIKSGVCPVLAIPPKSS